jgi:hypothetical protein
VLQFEDFETFASESLNVESPVGSVSEIQDMESTNHPEPETSRSEAKTSTVILGEHSTDEKQTATLFAINV